MKRDLGDVQELHYSINRTLSKHEFPGYVMLVFHDHGKLQAQLLKGKLTSDLSPPMDPNTLYWVLSAYHDGLRHGLTKKGA